VESGRERFNAGDLTVLAPLAAALMNKNTQYFR
jgi:hypothetical protein